MNNKEKHVLVQNGQRVSSEVFESGEAAKKAAEQINKKKIDEASGNKSNSLVESKQLLMG